MKFMSINDVAALTGLSRSTLAKKRCTGSGPAYFKTGGRQIRYDRTDVESWIASRRRTCTWRGVNDNIGRPTPAGAPGAKPRPARLAL